MSPGDVIEALARLGVRTSRSSLSRWVRLGLIPEPRVGSLGRGQGGFSEFNKNAVLEGYAVGMLLKEGVTVDLVQRAKEGKGNGGIIETMLLEAWNALVEEAKSRL